MGQLPCRMMENTSIVVVRTVIFIIVPIMVKHGVSPMCSLHISSSVFVVAVQGKTSMFVTILQVQFLNPQIMGTVGFKLLLQV
jgi:hypothetical protein